VNDAYDVGDDAATATDVAYVAPPAAVAATVAARVAHAPKPMKHEAALDAPLLWVAALHDSLVLLAVAVVSLQ
jgi:hypothetical protein